MKVNLTVKIEGVALPEGKLDNLDIQFSSELTEAEFVEYAKLLATVATTAISQLVEQLNSGA